MFALFVVVLNVFPLLWKCILFLLRVIFNYLETQSELTQHESEIGAFTLYSVSSYPSKMPCVMSCNI